MYKNKAAWVRAAYDGEQAVDGSERHLVGKTQDLVDTDTGVRRK